MSLKRNLARAERIHRFIKFKRTGTPESFARKMDMSLSSLYGVIKELKELGAPIGYCKFRQTYLYTKPVELQIGFIAPSQRLELLPPNQFGQVKKLEFPSQRA